ILRLGQPRPRLYPSTHAAQRIHQHVAGLLIDGELAELPVLLFLRQVVRRTEETLQQPSPGEAPDRVDSLEERLPVPSERPVRLWAPPEGGAVASGLRGEPYPPAPS